ncbi:MAG: PSD1 domain-containing protein [Bryobacterales bacterium]|nr:PSD1 domain-containing protein [Bryobacterales bacterium]
MSQYLRLLLLLGAASAFAAPPGAIEHFEKKVRPIFAAKCQACHGTKAKMGGLDLTSAAGFRAAGPLIDPEQHEKSRLLEVVSYEDRVKMPPTGKLADDELAALREWVKLGAPWPEAPRQAEEKAAKRADATFWSLQPLKQVTPPRVRNEGWVRNDVDRFILARLEANGLDPAPPADKLTLLRRVTLDLTGLPPSEAEIREFLADESPEAYARVIDRLLASPRYGERWGRHWLDVARYADSTGADEDHRYPYAWRYRDYVIDAFNADLPYDQFIGEQIAGDLLPSADGSEVNRRGIVATGFLALGPKLIAEQDKVKMYYDIVDEQIDVTGKAFLGITLACARCHDHKFDPVSTKDYYSLASIFASTKQLAKLEGTVSKLYFAPLVERAEAQRWEDHQKRVEEKQAEITRLLGEQGKRRRDALSPFLAAYMLAAREIYEDGKESKAVAAERSLDADVLERMANYLKPTKERRVHIEAWYLAKPADRERVAREFQEDFQSTARHREQRQAAWKKEADAARARGEEPPPAPVFLAGDNRFFTEISGGKGPFALPEKEEDKRALMTAESVARWDVLKAELDAIKKDAPPEPAFACGVAEGEPVEQHVFLRGNPETKGDPVPKRLPVVLAGDAQPPIASGSGRLELAGWIASPANPLTPRVMVNRLWQGHFGAGLVRTPSNFGLTGEAPTHPELLDWLAARFVADGWSIKAMHRLMLLSNAYQMDSEAPPAKREKDPDNRLWSRFSMRRMSVEEMRDTLLWLDGSIDLTMGGAMISGFGTDKEFSEDRKSLNPSESKRRTVYLPLRRSNLASVLNLFDFGDATTSNEARTQTNVAPQALYMMNSAFVDERARTLAKQLLRGDSADERRIERAWMAVLGREPTPEEAAAARDYLARFPARSDDDSGRELAWTSLCRTLVASNDFLYVH